MTLHIHKHPFWAHREARTNGISHELEILPSKIRRHSVSYSPCTAPLCSLESSEMHGAARNLEPDEINHHSLDMILLPSSSLQCPFWAPFFSFVGVERDLACRSPFVLLYQPRMIDGVECGAVCGMGGRGTPNTRRKRALVSLCQPRIQHDPTSSRTRTAVTGSRRITA
jgi:hypothetical protein